MSGHAAGRIVRQQLSFERQFVKLPNAWARDERLSFKARGVLLQLLSYQTGFSVSVKALQASTIKEGRDSILAALKELQAYGYLTIQRERTDDGRFRPVWHLTEPATPLEIPTHSPVDNTGSANPTRSRHAATESDSPHSPGTANPTVREELTLEDSYRDFRKVTTERPVESSGARAWWASPCPMTSTTYQQHPHRRTASGHCADCLSTPHVEGSNA